MELQLARRDWCISIACVSKYWYHDISRQCLQHPNGQVVETMTQN